MGEIAATDLRDIIAVLNIVTELERIADRVTNIFERIIFLATGSMPQVNVLKY